MLEERQQLLVRREARRKMIYESENLPALQAGSSLDENELRSLEAQVQQFPDRVKLRLKCLGYYWAHQQHCEKWVDHIIWLIENLPYDTILQILSQPGPGKENLHSIITEKWEIALKAWPDNPAVLANAAHFFIHSRNEKFSIERVIELLQRAAILDTANLRIKYQLLTAFKYKLANLTGPARIELLKSLLVKTEEFFQGLTPDHQIDVLPDLMLLSYQTNADQKCLSYASAVCRNYETFRLRPLRYKSLNRAYSTLGRLQLRSNDIVQAIKNLEQSVAMLPNEYDLSLDFQLALELLLREEDVAVIDFLRDCKHVRSVDPVEIDEWITDIQSGIFPDMRIPQMWADLFTYHEWCNRI